MAKTLHNFRIQDNVWEQFSKSCKNLGIPMTVIVEKLIENFVENPQLIIGEPEEMKNVPSEIQEQIDDIFITLEAIKKERKIQ